MRVSTVLTYLAEQFRYYLNTDKRFKLDEMPFEINAVYDVGRGDGNADGIAQGEYNEYVRFWDIVQANGTSTVENGTFAGHGWTDENFRPRYDIKPTAANQTFWCTGIQNLTQCLEKAGVTLDISNATNVNGCFSYSQLTHVPAIDIRKAKTNTNNLFVSSTKLQTIAGIKVDSGNTALSNIFNSCNELVTVLFTEDSAIHSSVNLKAATKLSRDSIRSIFAVLGTSSTTYTLTLSLTAVNAAFDDTQGVAGSTSQDWFDLEAGAPDNWNIVLA